MEAHEQAAAYYQLPFQYLKKHVYAKRQHNKRQLYRQRWWIHGEPRPGLRRATSGLRRFIVTPEVAKYRVFAWVLTGVVADHRLQVIARDDDYFFGVLHSGPHELWSLRLGSRLEDRPCYTPTKTFETFPFPWPPGKEPRRDPKVKAIAAAAKELVEKRDHWLNPPDISPEDLAKRTLTNLYNERPAWLDHLHAKLDAAVFAAYGWPATLTTDEILQRLLALNHQRSAAAEG